VSRIPKEKVFVALSGGVDSSVAAFLLQKEGYDVHGAYMRCVNLDGTSTSDERDARTVAAHLGIPFYTFDFEEEYQKRVVCPMIEGYRNGTTPNPDINCNKEIKFGLFLEKALELGADYIATGHYVRKKGNALYQAKDTEKDQTYFLWTLTKEQIKHCLFPIGNYKKSEVRTIAQEANLPNASKKDSQGICFLGKFSLRNFLKENIPPKEGNILDTEGNEIGTHDGAWFYTIGQRHIGNITLSKKGGSIKPHYVVAKDIEKNTITLTEGRSDPALYKKELTLANINLIHPLKNNKIKARIRYRGTLAPATLSENTLTFKEPQRAIAPGQSAVFYSKRGELLGGGVIL
jgi:tRNA-uridine 2-sulfurtransferase